MTLYINRGHGIKWDCDRGCYCCYREWRWNVFGPFWTRSLPRCWPSTSTWPGHRRRPSNGSAARDDGRRSRGTTAGLMHGGDAVPAAGGGDGGCDAVASVGGGDVVGDGAAADNRPGQCHCRHPRALTRRRYRRTARRPGFVDRPDRPPGRRIHHRLRCHPPDPVHPST